MTRYTDDTLTNFNDTFSNQNTNEANKKITDSSIQEDTSRREAFLKTAQGITGAGDGVLLALIFGLHVTEALISAAKPFLFPMAPVFAGFKLALLSMKAILGKGKKAETKFDVAIALASFIGITVAVIAAFTVLTAIAPIIFTAILGGSALYEGGKTIYHLTAAAKFSKTKEERNTHLKQAGYSALNFGIGALLTIGVGGLMVGGIKAFMWVGVAAAATATAVGTITAITGVVSLIRSWRKNRHAKTLTLTDNLINEHNRHEPPNYGSGNSNTLCITKKMSDVSTQTSTLSNEEKNSNPIGSYQGNQMSEIKNISEDLLPLDVAIPKLKELNKVADDINKPSIFSLPISKFGASAKLARLGEYAEINSSDLKLEAEHHARSAAPAA